MNETYIVHDKDQRILHIYNKRQGVWKDARYPKEWMAKKALEKALAKRTELQARDWTITPGSKFKSKRIRVRNLMSGKWVWEDINTPGCCSVGSEAYWSM